MIEIKILLYANQKHLEKYINNFKNSTIRHTSQLNKNIAPINIKIKSIKTNFPINFQKNSLTFNN